MKKIIVRIKGGLGNQLFCYAAAKRLAIVNYAELVIDDVTGFLRDRKYKRAYALDHFNITARKATPRERLEPFERYRRGLAKLIAKRKPFYERRYIEENGTSFDSRLLDLRINGTVYLDGLWQSETYFKDVEDTIRENLTFVTPTNPANTELAKLITKLENPVSIHIRWFSAPKKHSIVIPQFQFYRKAIEYVKGKVKNPHFIVFSDYIEHLAILTDSLDNYRLISVNNTIEGMAYADMWLMSLCRHHIVANSSFSWWGAWLTMGKERIVCVDKSYRSQVDTTVPLNWIQL